MNFKKETEELTRIQYLQKFPDGASMEIAHPFYQFTVRYDLTQGVKVEFGLRGDTVPTPSGTVLSWLTKLMNLPLEQYLEPPDER